MGNFGYKLQELRDRIDELEKMKGVDKKDCKCQDHIKGLKDKVEEKESKILELMDVVLGLQIDVDNLRDERDDAESRVVEMAENVESCIEEKDEILLERDEALKKLQIIDDLTDEDDDE